jgi:type I restriction enzyme S subunit
MSNKDKTSLVPKLRFPEFRSAGEWAKEKLGSFASISTEKVGDKTCVPMSITSGVGLVSQEDKFGRVIAGSSYKNYLLLKPNDFAYNKSATKEYPEGFLALYSDDKLAAVPNSIFTCFRIKGDSPAPRYLNYLFLGNLHGQWLRNFIQVGARAHGSLSINDSDLLALPVPLPKGKSSLAEQQKIADCLSSLDELIAAQARKVAALKTHKKGLMQQLFPREGETQPRFRFPEFRDAGAWKQVALGQLMTIKGRIGYRGYTVEDIVGAGEGAISLSPSNISAAGTLSFEKATYISWAKFYESPEIILEKNFTVLVKTGSTYGKVAFIKDLPHECTVNPQIVVLKPTSTNPYFLYLLISGELIQSRIEATVVGGAIPTLSQENISKFMVCVPSEAEQLRIADCQTALDDHIAAVIQDLETLKTHKNGLMQQLFPSLEATV